MANEFKVKKGLIVDGSNTVLDIQGTQGQLFSVTDSLTGDLFSVSDVSGIPILNVNSSGSITTDGSHLTILDGHISLKQSTDSGFTTGLTIERSANTQKLHIGMDGGAVNFNSPDGLAYKFRNNGTEKFTVDGSGNATFTGNVESQDTFILNYNNAGNKWQQLFDGSNGWNLRYYNGTSWSSNYINVNTSGNATFTGEVTATEYNLPSSGILDWANGDARIVEGLVNNYSLSFQTWDGANLTTALRLDGNNSATFTGTITAAGGSTNNTDDANILTLTASEHARLLVDTSSTSGHRATLALESNGNELTLGTTGSASYLDPVGELTISGQVIFPSAATTKPVLPNGFISRNDLTDTSGRHDIWGISEKYYPSNATAGDAWGIQWSGTPNDVVFVGSGTDRFTVSLDEGNVTAAGDVFSDGLYVNSTSAVGGTQVAIVQDGAQNLQRWGSTNDGSSQASYRFRVDQNFEFIGNSGSGDTITLKSSDGNATFAGIVTATNGRFTSTGDASAGSTAHAFQTGLTGSTNIIMDNNEIMARNNGAVATLNINPDGGTISFHSNGTSSAITDAGNATFAGSVTSVGLTVDYTGNRTGDAGILVTNDNDDWGIKVDKDGTTDYGILSQTDGENAIVVRNAAGVNKIQLQGDGDASFAGNVTAPRFILSSTGTTTPVNRYLYTDNTNAGTGRLIIQSGGGSAGYGGAINLFSHSHASKPGWVTAGISSGSGGKFTVNSQGLAGGTDVFTVDTSGNATFANNVFINATSTHHNYGGKNLTIGGTRATLSLLSTGTLSTIAMHSNNDTSKDVHINQNGSDGSINFYQYSIPQTAHRTLMLSGDGNLGVGDAAPTSISSNTYSLSVNSARTDLSGALINKANGTIKHQQYWDSSGYGFNLSANSGDFKWKVNNNDRMVVDKDGGLDIQGTAGQLFSVTNSLTGDLFSVSDVSGIPILNVNSSGVVEVEEIKVGSSQQIQIYHDGSNGHINENGTGSLIVSSAGPEVQIKGSSNVEYMARFFTNAGVKLYYNNSETLTVINGGVNITGTMTATSDVVAYSDKKLKENIKTLDGSKVLKMRGVSFDRIDTGVSSSGVIAQEMQKVAPELVSETDGTLGVSYGNITGYLIEAIKELKSEIEQLKKQIK